MLRPSWFVLPICAVSCAGIRGSRRRSALALNEGEQFGVDRSRCVAMPCGAPVDLERGSCHQLGRQQGRVGDRDDLVVVAVDDQRRHVDPLQVLGEVGLGERLDAVVGALSAASCPAARTSRGRLARPWRPAGWRREGRAEILEELRAVGEHAGADAVEHLDRQCRPGWPRSSASAAGPRRSAPPWRRAPCRAGRCSARPRRRRWSGRHESRPAGRVSRSAPPGRRRRCPCRCRSRAGWSGRDHAGHGRSRGSRLRGKKDICSSQASA